MDGTEDSDNAPPQIIRGPEARKIYAALGWYFVQDTDNVRAVVRQERDWLSVKATGAPGSSELVWDYGGNSALKEEFNTAAGPKQTITRLLDGGKVEVTHRELNHGAERTFTPLNAAAVRARIIQYAREVTPYIRSYVS
jgi:hypothetical protein